MNRRYGIIWTTMAFLWAALITYLLLMPPPEVIEDSHFPHRDKLAHMGVFAVWTVLLLLADLQSHNRPRYKMIAIIAIFYGIATEIMQLFVPGRSCDLWDIIADMVGIVSASYVVKYWLERRKK